nr:Chain A, ShSPI [Scolopendra hainanum]
CPQVCPAIYQPVFDEFGRMYSNSCEMQRARCLRG